MALDSAKKFLEDAKADKSLEEKVDSSENLLEAVAIGAKKLGYDFTVAELKEAIADEAEISIDELENVAVPVNCACFGGHDCVCFGSNCKAVLT